MEPQNTSAFVRWTNELRTGLFFLCWIPVRADTETAKSSGSRTLITGGEHDPKSSQEPIAPHSAFGRFEGGLPSQVRVRSAYVSSVALYSSG